MHGTLYRVEVKLQAPLEPTVDDERFGVGPREQAVSQGLLTTVQRFQEVQCVVLFRERTFHREQLRHSRSHGFPPSSAACTGEGEIAVRMPWRIRVGLGGQPGTATLTGMTFETRPRLA